MTVPEKYLRDASNLCGTAEKIYFPKNSREISELLKDFERDQVPVTIAGAGTGLAGARVPNGGVVISTESMNRLSEVEWDSERHRGRVVLEPGVVLKDFEDFLEQRGLFYPPDPTGIYASMGGTVATNASGARSFKYGPTRRYVTRLEVVLACGELLEIKRGDYLAAKGRLKIPLKSGNVIEVVIPDYVMPAVKNAAGYFASPEMDLIDLFIGQEGTLGFVTQIELEVFKKPEELAAGILFFTSEQESYEFMLQARRA